MPPHDPTPRRQGFLTILLVSGATVFFLFVLILITGGFFLYVVSAVLGMVLLGLFHYLVWGMALEREVAGESEEEQLRQRAAELAAAEDWNYPPGRSER